MPPKLAVDNRLVAPKLVPEKVMLVPPEVGPLLGAIIDTTGMS